MITLLWNNKFSIVKLEKKNHLHGWVFGRLQDTEKWVEKKIVLEFMNVYPDTTTK